MKAQDITVLHMVSAKSKENISLSKKNPPGQVGLASRQQQQSRDAFTTSSDITSSPDSYKQPRWQTKTLLTIRIS
jgi:hypothetical protein